MLTILMTILPVFLVMGSGYAAVRSGYVAPQVGETLNLFAVRFAMPTFLFLAIYRLDISHAFQFRVLASFYTGVIVVFAIGMLLARFIAKKRPGEAVAIGFGAMFSNGALLGIPIAERVFGATVMPSIFAIIAIHAGLLYAIGMVAMELARRDGIPLGHALVKAGKSIASNALMIGVIAGALINISAYQLPEPLIAAIKMIASAAIPVALIGIGASLTRYRISDDIVPVSIITLLSLIVHPAIGLVMARYVFGLDGHYVQAVVILAAMPPGTNGYIFALMYDRAVSIAASAILVATTLSIVTITAWIAILEIIVPI